MKTVNLTHRDVLTIALPIMFSNLTTPLIGVADMAVLGQQGDPVLIGAASIGAQIFTMVFWAFGFLRMGAAGLTAQADGKNDRAEVLAILYRSLIIAFCAGVLLWLSQYFIAETAFYLIPASQSVEAAAREYFNIRIWSAPATLANYALLGWFIGAGRADIALGLQIFLNGLNILLDILFVAVFGLGVSGVAYGTVLAEILAACVGVITWGVWFSSIRTRDLWSRIFQTDALKRMLSVNGDIMIRTLCLMLAFVFLTAQSSGIDDVTLAANSVLLGLLGISSYFLDGYAFAAERFVGHSIGAGDHERFRRAVILSSQWAFSIAVLVSIMFALAGNTVISLITTSEEVRAHAGVYLIWAVASPVIGVACFQLDGIFIGAARTKDMRNMMLVSLAAYFLAWKLLTPVWGNHGLWGAFMIFFAARAITLACRLPALERDLFPSSGPASIK